MPEAPEGVRIVGIHKENLHVTAPVACEFAGKGFPKYRAISAAVIAGSVNDL
jgi:hypothetical protein